MARRTRQNPALGALDADTKFLTQTVADSRYSAGSLAPLYGWLSKLALAKTGRANAYLMGDSIAEGYGAATIPARWASQMADILRATYGASGVGGIHIPARYFAVDNTAALFPSWTFTGSTVDSTYGPGARSKQLNAGSSGTISRQCTSADLYFRISGTNQTVNVSIDGGAATTVPVNAVAKKWSSGPLSDAVHSFTVTPGPTGDAFQVLCGGTFYRGDETAGVMIWDGARSGSTFEFHDNADDWKNHLAVLGTDLLVLGCITNDARSVSNGYLPSVYAAKIDSIVTKARTAVPNIPILFMTPPEAPGPLLAPWSEYLQVIKNKVAATSLTAFYDMGASIPASINVSDPYGFRADSVHFSSRGNALLARLGATAVSPR